MRPQRLPHTEFVKIYSKVPRLCVDIIIKTKHGIVLSKRLIPPYVGFWHTPGGTVLYGEKLEHAVKRIAKDETGLNVSLVKHLGIIEFPIFTHINHSISVVYLVKPLSGKLRGSVQGKDIQFFKELPSKTVGPQAKFIKEFVL